MTRNRDFLAVGKMCRLYPTGDTTDLHNVGHRKIGCTCHEGFPHVCYTPPVFPGLNRGLNFGPYRRMAEKIRCMNRFFDPGQVFLVEQAHALDCLVYAKRLIEIGGDPDVVASNVANSTNNSNVNQGVKVNVS